MKTWARHSKRSGFTLVELLVTLTLLSVIALTAMPLAEIASIRWKEQELRQSLRQIRVALDQYKKASDTGLIPKAVGESGYPPSLEVLTAPIASSKEVVQVPLILMRSLPRDPFNTDPTLPAASTWALRSYASPVNDPRPGSDVFDVHSQSQKKGLNGIQYDQW
ncbi:prepilin-type N-terminal cleavage/methylation domain-containing protein [Polaromonas jejuensis]|uniref:Prepilin-type N-terminal cleavage/methylation domain-containing protein n=1 Tax=Polaromonas jejuensis TaxID=457502 RepID=A0ABW0QBF4_9BURK|nr:prepilin-type N-terminal cleavage/methylation domain-containing protein [Polaromonas jejuensis]